MNYHNNKLIIKQQISKIMQQSVVNFKIEELLQNFNDLDDKNIGYIKIDDALNFLREVTDVTQFEEDLIQRVIFCNEKMVTFDQLLTLLYEIELDLGREYNTINYKLIQFLKLLHEYRKKCQESGKYGEAQKITKKILQIEQKQLQRYRYKLLNEQKQKIMEINSLQENKFVQFNQAWNQYLQKYQNVALNSIEQLKLKLLKELNAEQHKIRNSCYENCIKPSKRVLELRVKEKWLVKQKKYMEAQKLKNMIEKLQYKQKQVKRQQINEKIKNRLETFQKNQEAMLSSYLQKIEKERTEQYRKKQLDLQKMSHKLKNIQNEIITKQATEIQISLQKLRGVMCSREIANYRRKGMYSLDRVQYCQKREKEKIYASQFNMVDGKRRSLFRVRRNSLNQWNNIGELMDSF